MKKSALFITLLLVILSFYIFFAQSRKSAPDALSVIHNRKSVRHFTGRKVSREDLITLAKAAMAAPTAVNMQPWSFIIVTDRKSMDSLADALPYAKMLDKAGAAIVVCALPQKAFRSSTELAVIDSACAGENLLLAAEALGLGAVWTGVYPDEDRMDAVRKELGIPGEIIPLNVIPVGYPTFEDKPKDKFKKENIHWDRW
jgi:nitroreductase